MLKKVVLTWFGKLPKEVVVFVGSAILLSLVSIWIAYDFGKAFAGKIDWNFGPPVLTQTLAVMSR